MDFTQDIRPGEANPLTTDKLRNHPQLFLAALGIFLYVGAEVAIGSFLINYFQLPAIGNLTAAAAARYVALYWGGAMVGRFIGSAILRRYSTGVVLGFAAAVACTAGPALHVQLRPRRHVEHPRHRPLQLHHVPLHLRPRHRRPRPPHRPRLQPHRPSIVGGAIIPVLQGRIADSIGVHHAFLIPVVCYIYIALFGFTRPRFKATPA